MESFDKLRRIIAVTGHYGCGKTTLAVNLAMDFRARGEEVTVIDLDLINPYFVASGFRDILTTGGISVISSQFAGSLVDTPAITGGITAAIRGSSRVIIDLGGDDVGARALGRFHQDILEVSGMDLIYLFSIYRPQTGDKEDVRRHIEEIEYASRQKVRFLVNSSNLGQDTTVEDIEQSRGFAREISEYTKIPLLCTLSTKDTSNGSGYYMVRRYVKLPWEIQI